MRLGVLLVLACGLVATLIMAGCADVSATQKVGDFGTAFGASADEQKAIDWFKQTYGDPQSNNDQPARFVEPLVTSGMSDKNLPVNKVTTFPVTGGSVYFFVIYDNFVKGDPITVSWTYVENGKEVTRVQKAAGGDFGRFIVEFQKPDSGWGKGRQRITVTGRGTSAEVMFTIGDSLATSPLPYNPAEATATATTVPTTIAPTCAVGKTLCSGMCTNLYSDNNNCGACGMGCDPELGLTCKGGTCVAGATQTQPSGTPTMPSTQSASCNPPMFECYGVCTDLKTDNNNCGFCGFPCESNSGTTSTCINGQCQASCKNGYANCDGNSLNGCETRTTSDIRHCGACGNSCSSTNGMGGCWNGTCTIICNNGFENCNGQISDGCESNIMTDVRNCGTCGNWCPRRASDSAIPYCTQGQCTY